MARRRKEERRAGIASRGIVRRLGRCATGLSLIAIGCLSGATPRGQPWTSAVTLPHRRNGLNARRMAVWSTLREPSLGRHVHHELMRSALLDLPPIIPATACHQRNYVERYSRCIGQKKNDASSANRARSGRAARRPDQAPSGMRDRVVF